MSILTPPPTQQPVDINGNSISALWKNWIQLLYGVVSRISNSGPTSGRPTQNLWLGMTYFDTTLNRIVSLTSLSPIIWTPIMFGIQSMIILNTANGYGSINNMIRRFTTIATNIGSDITYADSATLGASFTINTSGIYAINYNDSFSAASTLGISLNSNQLTTVVNSINVANILSLSTPSAANYSGTASSTLFLTAGSVIRAHDSGTTTGTQPTVFTITKIG